MLVDKMKTQLAVSLEKVVRPVELIASGCSRVGAVSRTRSGDRRCSCE